MNPRGTSLDPMEVAGRSEAHAHAVGVVLAFQAGLERQARMFRLRAARDRAQADLNAAIEALAIEEAENELERNLTLQMIDMARESMHRATAS